jgi:hypothetical protein
MRTTSLRASPRAMLGALMATLLSIAMLAVPGARRADAQVTPDEPGLITVGTNADGRLELFLRRPDNTMWHKWQGSPGGGWSGWHSLGVGFISQPSVSINADGRLELFAVYNDGRLFHRWQGTPGGGWSGWADLGGELWPAAVAVAPNADGRLQVFAASKSLATPKHLMSRWQKAGGVWSTWVDFGGPFSTAPGVGRNKDGRLEVFVGYNDHALYHFWQFSPNGQWSGIGSLGLPYVGFHFGSTPTIGVNADGRLEVFVPEFRTQSDRDLYHVYQATPNGPAWGGWGAMGGSVVLSVPAVARNADGRMELFIVQSDQRNVWHRWQTAPNGGWSGWSDMSGGRFRGNPAAVRNLDGRLEVFAVDFTDGAVWHRWQGSPNGPTWSGWHSLGHP